MFDSNTTIQVEPILKAVQKLTGLILSNFSRIMLEPVLVNIPFYKNIKFKTCFLCGNIYVKTQKNLKF